MNVRMRKIMRHAAVAIAAFVCMDAAVLVVAVNADALYPLKLDRVTLTDGKKTVVFQSMIHMASPAFYGRVREALTAAKNAGYIYDFEGVSGGNAGQVAELTKRLSPDIDIEGDFTDAYRAIAELTGLAVQDNKTFEGIVDDRDFNVDATFPDLLAQYDKVHPTECEGPCPQRKSFKIEDLQRVVTDFRKLSQRERRVLEYVGRNLMSLVIHSSGIFGAGLGDASTKVLLEHRNRILADAIVAGHENAFVTYGDMHFPGFLALLQLDDPSWHVVSTVSDTVFR